MTSHLSLSLSFGWSGHVSSSEERGGNEGGAKPLLEMIWVDERQLCDELSSARHGMACAS